MNLSKYDLIVVGGGILGTFHAYHALVKGLRVLQLEKDNYPVSSTVRNFGQVVPSGMSGKWFDYGVRGLEIYKSIQNEMDISVRNNGSIYIASDADEVQMLHELSAHYKQVGYAHELWSKEQILKIYPMMKDTYVKEAIVFKQEVSVEPDLMIHRLHAYMQTKFEQYTLKYDATVMACEDNADLVKVTTSDMQLFEGDKVIICNGYEFKILYRSLFDDSGLKISKLQMMRTKPMKDLHLPGNILTGLTTRRYESFEEYCPSFHQIKVPEHYKELREQGIHILFKQAIDGSIIVGDSHEYAQGNQLDELGFAINSKINDLMLNEANRIITMDQSMIASSWAGFYAQHDNDILEVDVSDRIHVRTGIGGKGMTASAGYAEQSIEAICG
ncbi:MULTISPECIES: TIGR03364 family FAD-dependent oxidoreductase [Sphingobacterium]|uniref:TIGR03364 family FAD-dependent oxidoreductase n=1 Tax=Sphingobacterium TaxID=28453 RepID=UPI00104BA8FB|nr:MULTISPECIES: TIGR03364 family FAD-dependent oxidoreductase [unclassified Sphingobacterium]MCS3555929.1 FAD dependent oxidoreductase TIGR03364 [Sphingobacterium sp. JUb21]TCR00209.1 FAD dependent oxidoreductase TIGR03364 [Sphingobacterium sp. JUb20]